nr:molybdopterin-dependent oxidoreductase [Desulfurococcales archaeon]
MSAECTVEGRVSGYGDVASLASQAASRLARLLGVGIELEGLAGWEFIGGRFNLYTYTTRAPRGVLRVVEAGGYPIGVYAALPAGAAPGAGPGWRASEDGAMGPVYLRRPPEEPGSDDAPPGQRFIPRMVVYAVEGVPRVDPGGWRLSVEGSVEEPATYSLESLSQGLRGVRGDFHCVTGWSVRGRLWEGVPLADLLA